MNWWQYVQTWCGQDNPTDIGRKIGIAGPTVHRWLRSEPKPDSVRAFAQAYGRPTLEAFVAAGFLTPEQANEKVIRQDINTLTDDDLAGALLARLKELRNATQVQESQQRQGSASSGGEGGQPPKTQGSSERRPDPVKRSGEVQPTARGRQDIARVKALKAQSAEKTSR